MESHDLSVSELLRHCLDRPSDELWYDFVQLVQPVIRLSVVRTLRRWRGSSNDLVEDLTQQTYLPLCDSNLRALRRLRMEQPESLQAYLRIVAASVVVDHFRSQQTQKRGSGKMTAAIDEVSPRVPPEIEERLLAADLEKHLRICTDDNYGRDRVVFWLYYRNGLTSRAIAGIGQIGLTQKGVEALIYRLTKCIRLRIKGNLPSTASTEGGGARGISR